MYSRIGKGRPSARHGNFGPKKRQYLTGDFVKDMRDLRIKVILPFDFR